MKKPQLLVVTLALACGAASADVIIDTIPDWDGSVSGGWTYIAQTFVVPTTDNILSTWEEGLSRGNGDYTLSLYMWDRASESVFGSALYSSSSMAVPGSMTFIEHSIDVALTSGVEYAMVTTLTDEADGIAFMFSNQYADGYANFTDGDIYSTWSFNQNSGFDMAFRAVFVVPAPSSLALLGLGALAIRRRR